MTCPVPYTCPMIDKVIEECADFEHAVYKIIELLDEEETSYHDIRDQLHSAYQDFTYKDILEDIRKANSDIREWGEDQEELADSHDSRIDDLESDVTDLENQIDELKGIISDLQE